LDFPTNEKLRKSIVFLRLGFLVGIGLIIGGSCLTGNYKDPSAVKLGLKLAKAGYIVLVFILAALVAFAVALWMQQTTSLGRYSQKVD
jgi:ABC-type antimicrobial peptide transport system permease subunit